MEIREDITINVLRIIDEIEALVENGKVGFMGKRLINEEEIFTKIQQLRSALPKSMKEAEDLMRKAEAVVKSAQTEADRLIDTAEREAERVVTDARNRAERNIAESKAHADRQIADAQGRADRTIADADGRAQTMVSTAEAQAGRTIENANNQAARTIESANNQAQKTIDEANDRAANIEADARKRADDMVAEHTITLRAHEEGDALVQQSQRDSEDMRNHADNYAYEVLEKITGVLDKLNSSVEAGKNQLRPSQSDAFADSYSGGGYVNTDFTNGYRN